MSKSFLNLLRWLWFFFLIFFFFFLLFNLVMAGLSCSMQDLQSLLQYAGSFRWGIWALSCGMWDLVPWPRIDPVPVHWEHRVLATGPPKMFPLHFVNMVYHINWFGNNEPSLHLWDKSQSWCMVLLMYCWVWFANILLGIFTSVFINDIGL